jgi:hypothetical protein
LLRSVLQRCLLLSGVLLALAGASSAAADGEAGLVVQEGDVVTTHCVAFQGDGIRGDQLLRAAGYTFDAYGGGSGLAVCSINDRGCKDASSFSSCFCECQGSSCTYWAFFTRGYGKSWAYSVVGFNLLEARDGDVHGWKWGAGGPSSAPAPREVTFEQICGHAPRGGVAPTATPTLPPPTAAATSPPVLTPTVATSATATGAAASPSPGASPPLVTITNAVPTATAGADATPAAPVAGDDDEGDSGNSSSLAWFGAVAAVLLAVLGAGLVWRARHAG